MNKLTLIFVGLLTIASCSSYKNKEATVQEAKIESFKPFVEILSNDALSIIEASATINVLAEGFKWTEGPLWLESEGYLIFSDIPNNKIMKYHPTYGLNLYLDKSGATNIQPGDNSQGSNGLLLNQQGQLVLLQQGDRRVAVMDADLSKPKSKFITLAGHYDNKRLNSPNDAVLHSNGSVFFTDPAYGLTDRMNDKRKELSFQGIYRVSKQGAIQLLDDKIKYPNGIAITADEKQLIVAVSDEETPHWLAYDLSPTGKVSNKRVFITASDHTNIKQEQGVPDGMAVHSSSHIFATAPGGVWLLNQQGEVLAKINTGKFTANCTLSADEKTLYMTAHDTLMSVELK